MPPRSTCRIGTCQLVATDYLLLSHDVFLMGRLLLSSCVSAPAPIQSPDGKMPLALLLPHALNELVANSPGGCRAPENVYASRLTGNQRSSLGYGAVQTERTAWCREKLWDKPGRHCPQQQQRQRQLLQSTVIRVCIGRSRCGSSRSSVHNQKSTSVWEGKGKVKETNERTRVLRVDQGLADLTGRRLIVFVHVARISPQCGQSKGGGG
ncbi:hypothetical protein F5148DRAFT_276458 [Russula earlei]|uniref:Uncharacterized protein n=1 Tax=Russula earlei TaxID=71964 RepID=A0ACC0U434_9AGAM|nr:hypothetical protein F5148DRAFT_276458 [Russula earlei]